MSVFSLDLFSQSVVVRSEVARCSSAVLKAHYTISGCTVEEKDSEFKRGLRLCELFSNHCRQLHASKHECLNMELIRDQ